MTELSESRMSWPGQQLIPRPLRVWVTYQPIHSDIKLQVLILRKFRPLLLVSLSFFILLPTFPHAWPVPVPVPVDRIPPVREVACVTWKRISFLALLPNFPHVYPSFFGIRHCLFKMNMWHVGSFLVWGCVISASRKPSSSDHLCFNTVCSTLHTHSSVCSDCTYCRQMKYITILSDN